jgi:phasin family protein
MVQVPEQVSNWNKARVETFNRVAQIALQSVEEIANLQINATRAALADGVKHANALIAARDPQELVQLNAGQIQAALEKTVAYTRSAFEIGATVQGELTKVIEERVGELNSQVGAALDKAVKSGPAGSEVAVAAIKSAIAAANTAYGNMSKAAKQVVDLTEANVTAATQAVTKKKEKATA